MKHRRMDTNVYSFNIDMQLQLLGQSSVCDSTKHNGLVTHTNFFHLKFGLIRYQDPQCNFVFIIFVGCVITSNKFEPVERNFKGCSGNPVIGRNRKYNQGLENIYKCSRIHSGDLNTGLVWYSNY